jgi:hypothetical protein
MSTTQAAQFSVAGLHCSSANTKNADLMLLLAGPDILYSADVDSVFADNSSCKTLTSSSVSRVRAACRILDRAICTRQSSLLLRRPYSPTSLSSPSRRSFSKGRLGFLKVLPSAKHLQLQTRCTSPVTMPTCTCRVKTLIVLKVLGVVQQGSKPNSAGQTQRVERRTVAVIGYVRHPAPMPIASYTQGRGST